MKIIILKRIQSRSRVERPLPRNVHNDSWSLLALRVIRLQFELVGEFSESDLYSGSSWGLPTG